MEKAPFHPLDDFTHVALIGGPPQVAVVHPGVQAKTLAEFVALSKSTPKGISYGSPGPGTHGHLLGELFRMRTSANMVHIPYKGARIALVDLVAGHIPAAFITLTTAASQLKAGKVRALAHSANRRLQEIAGVPTFAESGYPDLVATTWFSLSGPAGMQANLVARLNREIRDMLASPDIRQRLAADGIEPNDLDPQAFTAFLRAEIARWTPIARSAK